MPDHYCPDCGHVDYDCRGHNDYCPDCGDAIQQDSEKIACSCKIWEFLPNRRPPHQRLPAQPTTNSPWRYSPLRAAANAHDAVTLRPVTCG
jgi:hypothetical protein